VWSYFFAIGEIIDVAGSKWQNGEMLFSIISLEKMIKFRIGKK
jgi:hypothetical protein